MRITKEARCAKNAREYIDNRPRLVEGKIYTLIFRQQPERSEKHTAIKKRMRFLKAFPHHALFENPYGIKRSFTWWEVEKLPKGDQPHLYKIFSFDTVQVLSGSINTISA